MRAATEARQGLADQLKTAMQKLTPPQE